jgi:hypothetical protein
LRIVRFIGLCFRIALFDPKSAGASPEFHRRRGTEALFEILCSFFEWEMMGILQKPSNPMSKILQPETFGIDQTKKFKYNNITDV